MQKKKLLNFRPFVFTAVSIVLGVFCAKLFYTKEFLKASLVLVAYILFLSGVIFFSTRETMKSKLLFSVFFALMFAFSAGLLTISINKFDDADLNNHYYTVTGKVTEVKETDYGNRLILDKVKVLGNYTGKLEYKISVYVYGDTEADIGDVVKFSEYLNDNGLFYEGEFFSYNLQKRIKYTATVLAEDIQFIGKNLSVFDHVHLFIRDTLKSGLTEKVFSVGYALLLGNTDNVDTEIITSYRNAGVAHVFAVSGLHIGFIASVLGFLFSKLKANKTLKAIVITLFLFAYSGVCGFSSSSLRASVMSAVMLFGGIKGERYDSLSSVGLACSIILLFSPVELFNSGFQLSFIVVLGIILLSTKIAKVFSFLPNKLATALGVVISAQLASIPACLNSFGEFSIVAVLVNLIAIPIVGVIFVLLLVGVLFGGLFVCANVFLFLPEYALRIVNTIITAVDYSQLIIGGFTFAGFALFYYIACIIPSGILNLKKVWQFVSVGVCLVVFAVGTLTFNLREMNTAKAYVVGSDKICATVIDDKDYTVMVVSLADNVWSTSRLKRLKDKHGVDKIDTLIIGNGAVPEIQNFITRLSTVFVLREVCYFGDTDNVLETVVQNAFGLKISGYRDGVIKNEIIKTEFKLNGYLIECSVRNNKIAVFAKLGDKYSGYLGSNKSYNLLVVYDYLQNIFSLYKSDKKVSYRNNSKYLGAENEGTFIYKMI